MNNLSSRGDLGRIIAGAAFMVLILFVYHVLTWQNFTGLIKASVTFERLFSDFVIYYYPMGEAIFQTGMPVPGFLYSPFIAILLAVFPPLGLSISLVVWGGLQVLSVLLYILLFRKLVPAGLLIQFCFAALVFTSFPLMLNFMGGQVSVFIMVALLGMLVFNEQSRSSAAGLFAFSVSFKFYPVMFMASFASRRHLRFILFQVAACGFFLFVVPGLLLGAGDTLHFYGRLLESFGESDWVVSNPHSQYFPHVVLRLSGALGINLEANLRLLYWISFGVAAANMGLIFLVQRARLRYSNLWSFQLVFLTIPFVLKTSWPHDFVFLCFTQALLVWHLLDKKKAAEGSGIEGHPFHLNTALIASLLFFSMVFSNLVFFNLFGNFTGYGFYGFLFWADLLLLLALYLEFLPLALKRIRKPGSE